MDISVLERRRSMLQTLYHQQQENDNHHANFDLLLPHWQHMKPDDHFPTYSDSNNSSSTMSKHNILQCNSSSSTKKRKTEFDIESKSKLEESEVTVKAETSTNSKSSTKATEVDYIHVRARRGQATDSHSLAERARREKISKKMKCLQDLVPGCNKVTGKAGMLDEIINYVQSLQKQVEFLSMKLATVNPRVDVNVENFFTKEIPAYLAQIEASNSENFQYNPMQANTTTMDQSQIMAAQKQLQLLSGWDPDWTSLLNVGFH